MTDPDYRLRMTDYGLQMRNYGLRKFARRPFGQARAGLPITRLQITNEKINSVPLCFTFRFNNDH